MPVFVLPLVVLPGEPLPLQLFEPKYLRMLEYLEGEQEAGRVAEFVVCTSDEESVAAIGCVVQFVHLIERAEDGRAVVLTFGSRPVELIRISEEGPYPTGLFLEVGEEELDESEATGSEAIELFRELAGEDDQIVFQEEELDDGAEIVQPGGGMGPLSYRLAISLNLPVKEKLSLLSKGSEENRLHRLIDIMNFDLAASKVGGDTPETVH